MWGQGLRDSTARKPAGGNAEASSFSIILSGAGGLAAGGVEPEVGASIIACVHTVAHRGGGIKSGDLLGTGLLQFDHDAMSAWGVKPEHPAARSRCPSLTHLRHGPQHKSGYKLLSGMILSFSLWGLPAMAWGRPMKQIADWLAKTRHVRVQQRFVENRMIYRSV